MKLKKAFPLISIARKIMKIYRILAVFIVSSFSFSEQGLALRFIIEKDVEEGLMESYENTLLVSFDKEHTFTVSNQYELVLYAESVSTEEVAIRFEYLDLNAGELGTSNKVEGLANLENSEAIMQESVNSGIRYQLTLLPSYMELPTE